MFKKWKLVKNATFSTSSVEMPECSLRAVKDWVLVVLWLVQTGSKCIVSDLQNTSDLQTVGLQELENLLHSPVDVSELTV